MLAITPLGFRHELFQDALLRAVTEGQFPSGASDLGDETRSVIEANTVVIADAYDAFEREADGGGWRVSGAPPNC
jgi:hypothetical protein